LRRRNLSWLAETLPGCWAIFMSKRFNATPDREVFPAIESEATGIFVRQSWTRGCNLG